MWNGNCSEKPPSGRLQIQFAALARGEWPAQGAPQKLPRLSQLLPRPQLSRRKNHSRLAKLEQRAGPPPVKKEWARGSIEWLTEQEKARSTAEPTAVAHAPPDID